MSNTPETDATEKPLWGDAQELCLLRELCRKLERERDEARECFQTAMLLSGAYKDERDKARAALQRIADCDWVITLPNRMDAVRKIARDTLEGVK